MNVSMEVVSDVKSSRLGCKLREVKITKYFARINISKCL